MVKQELAQRAVLEALEAKIGAVSGFDGLTGEVILELYLWDDLAEKYSAIFKGASTEDFTLAIAEVERKSNGHFKLLSLKPLIANRDVLRVALQYESGRPIEDVSNLYWKIQYTVSSPSSADTHMSGIFWLTPREVYSVIGGKRCSFSFKPSGVQYRLLEWFSENTDFDNGIDLAVELKTTKRTIATEISKLRKKANAEFGIGADSFIESNQGEGYRIGRGIKIKLDRATT